MFFVTPAGSQMSMPGGVQVMAGGYSAAGMSAGTLQQPMAQVHHGAIPSAAAAPPSYEAIVLDPNGPRSQTNLFVRKLASAVKESDMKALFEQYGTILSFALMRDIHTGESLGTAFVRYRTHDEARAAMAGLDGTELYGRPISIQWAKKEHDGTPCGDARRKIHKLFVRNIPLSVTARHLRQVFSQFGVINNVTLHSDTAPALPKDAPADTVPAQMRNIAFILFQDDGAAERAVGALHNTCPFPSCEGIPLMVKLAEDNRDRLGRKQKPDNIAAANSAATAMLLGASGTATTPSSAAISPAQIPLDGSGIASVMSAPLMHAAQGLSYTPATAGATPAPVLHAATDANGNTTYVYLSAPATQTPPAPQQRVINSPATTQFFVQTPNGLQAISAPAMAPQQVPTYFTSAATNPGIQSFYPSMALPHMFVDAQGNPIHAASAAPTAQQNMLMQNFYSSFATAQQMAQLTPQQQPLQQPTTPSQRFLAPATPTFVSPPTAGRTDLVAAPSNSPYNINNRAYESQHVGIAPSMQSVSPQLSSAGSNANMFVTHASSVLSTPVENGMVAPTSTLQPGLGAPRTLVPSTVMTLPAAVSIAEEDPEHPLFNYESLHMNETSGSLTATSSMTGAHELPMKMMGLRIEDDKTDSDIGTPVASYP